MTKARRVKKTAKPTTNSKKLVERAKSLEKTKLAKKLVADETPLNEPAEQFKINRVDVNECELIVVGEAIATAEQAMRRAQVDPKLWHVVSQEINSWEVAGRLNPGQDEKGRWKSEKLWKQLLWRVKFKLQRRAPRPIQDAIQDLTADLKKAAPAPPKIHRPKTRPAYLLEISLADAHFGKRCWGAETGDDFDLEIASSDYLAAVDDLLEKIANYKIGKIIFPIGNDFFNQDSWLPMTARGTVVDSVDTRFQLVFRAGVNAIDYALKRCREVADVHCLWIPGNHDPATSWYLCEVLSAMFHKDKHITFDNEPTARKYFIWGKVLLGYTHLHNEKMKDLPLIMAREQQENWSKTKFHAWRCGHFHKKKAVDYTAGDTFNGVRVDILPSLSGTDKWHYDQGYVGNHRTAEAHLWDQETGHNGYFSTMARTERTRLGITVTNGYAA